MDRWRFSILAASELGAGLHVLERRNAMLLRTRFLALCLIAPMVLLAFSGNVFACCQPQAPRPPANPPPPPAPCYKLIDGLDGQGRTRVFVWCVIKRIFNTTTPHSCACGHG